jgi:hypothetical protein
VYRYGDNACPTGYATKSVLYGGFMDGRRCPSTCTCTKSGGECYASATPYRFGTVANMCATASSDIEITSLDESCLMAVGADPTGLILATSASVRSGSAMCVGQEPNPTGSVTGTNPVTVCCTN